MTRLHCDINTLVLAQRVLLLCYVINACKVVVQQTINVIKIRKHIIQFVATSDRAIFARKECVCLGTNASCFKHIHWYWMVFFKMCVLLVQLKIKKTLTCNIGMSIEAHFIASKAVDNTSSSWRMIASQIQCCICRVIILCMDSTDWLIEHGFMSAPTQYRLYGRRFLQVWWPNQQCQSTEGWRLVIQTGLNLTMLTSPCYNTTTCMQLLHKKII